MKLIRRVAAAFTLWALAIGVWAALSHLTSVPGPARASTATLERVATVLEGANSPGASGAPRRAAAGQLRRTAHTVGRINGAIEHAVGKWVDHLGHGATHGRELHLEAGGPVSVTGAGATVGGTRRFTISVDARSGGAGTLLGELHARRAMSRVRDAGFRGGHAGIWIDRTVEAPAGSSEADLRLRAARRGETFSLMAAEAGSPLHEASIQLEIDANLDRRKLKERIEKLLDLLEDLNSFERGK